MELPITLLSLFSFDKSRKFMSFYLIIFLLDLVILSFDSTDALESLFSFITGLFFNPTLTKLILLDIFLYFKNQFLKKKSVSLPVCRQTWIMFDSRGILLNKSSSNSVIY